VVRRAVFLVALASCTGDIDQGEQVANLSPQQQLAQTAWVKQARPALRDGTCDTCHAGQMTQGAPAYMAGMTDLDARDTMVAFVPSVISLGSPRTSPVLLKGMHEGPAISAAGATALLTWITYEQGARMDMTMEIETAHTPIADCAVGAPGDPTCTVTTIDLSAAGSTGSTITLYGKALGADLYVQQLEATAGPSGLTLVHPIFRSWPAAATDPKPEANDTFYNVSLNLAAGMKAQIGSMPTYNFIGFAATDPISVKFDMLSTKP
jgi:hypothetical protein